MQPHEQALFTDLYELTMLRAYREHGLTRSAVFDLTIRSLPPERSYLIAGGIEDVLDYLEGLHFTDAALGQLETLGVLSADDLRWLAALRFEGDVDAVPEGTPVFADEPLLRVEAPLPVAQLVETYVLNQMHLQTMLASKAARVVEAAAGRSLIDFGARRAHGTEAAMTAARTLYLAGFNATSNVLAGVTYGIPTAGTMAHSYVQAYGDEAAALRTFAETHAEATLLVDTYDTIEGVERVVALAEELDDAFTVRAIRLDSGDLLAHALRARALLDAAGLNEVRIVASGGLDEYSIAALVGSGAPIDAFGVGTAVHTSADAPSLEAVYKLAAYDGAPRAKRSEGKATLGGPKQVYRRYDSTGTASGDTIALTDETVAGEPLLRPVMRGGRRLDPREPLDAARARTIAARATLPPALRTIERSHQPYPVGVTSTLRAASDSAR